MTNPTPVRGKVWRVRFDPAEGDEIKKVRTAVVISENAVGRLRLKIVVPITEWKSRYASYPWFVYLSPTPNQRADQRFRSGCLSGQVCFGNPLPRPAWRTDIQRTRRYRQRHRRLRRRSLTVAAYD